MIQNAYSGKVLNDPEEVDLFDRAANVRDNVPREWSVTSLKKERGHDGGYAIREEADENLCVHIDPLYDRGRRRSARGYQSPVEYDGVE